MAIGFVAPVSLVAAESAHAFTWDRNTESVTIHDGDQDISFDVFFYKASIDGDDTIDGLNASAKFSLLDRFDASTKQARFKVDLSNFSNADIWSSARLTGMAFNVDPNLKAASFDGDAGTGFDKAIVDGKYPEGVKNVDVCYTGGGNSCSGGGNAGLTLGKTGSFYTTLKFDTTLDRFDIHLDTFLARWQSLTSNIDGKYGDTYKDASGVGYGQVPTPALIPAIIGSGVAALRKRKKQTKQETQPLCAESTVHI